MERILPVGHLFSDSGKRRSDIHYPLSFPGGAGIFPGAKGHMEMQLLYICGRVYPVSRILGVSAVYGIERSKA